MSGQFLLACSLFLVACLLFCPFKFVAKTFSSNLFIYFIQICFFFSLLESISVVSVIEKLPLNYVLLFLRPFCCYALLLETTLYSHIMMSVSFPCCLSFGLYFLPRLDSLASSFLLRHFNADYWLYPSYLTCLNHHIFLFFLGRDWGGWR